MPKQPHTDKTVDFDLFVIGGGINGCGIARDAAGRGMKVGLAEMNDLASATSSASTKLFHGGLRYLEFFEFRLVREALIEREVLLTAMPHISWPMRFVLPYHAEMRFEGNTPLAKLLGGIMPWMKGRRPAWLIRLGLFMYDHLGGRKILPPTRTVNLTQDPAGAPLDDKFSKAFEYSDCWVEDSRLVVLNARDAEQRGAQIMTRTKVTLAERNADGWIIHTEDRDSGTSFRFTAKALVNAGGPWVEDIIHNTARINSTDGLRLVRGSHIVTRKLYDHDRCYFFQGTDGRICFAIPYEDDFTLIGTTDVDHDDPDELPVCTPEEQAYLLDFVSGFFNRTISNDDVVWSYAGVRPLYNDGAASATAATRDYVLRIDAADKIPMLNVFGGKITTYRKLAESAMAELTAYLPGLNGTDGNWTARVTLPGGDFPVDGFDDLCAAIGTKYDFLHDKHVRRLARAYGTDVFDMLANCSTSADLGTHFGADIYAVELAWSVSHEWVRSAEDFVWRRTRLGLKLDEAQIKAIDRFITDTCKHAHSPKVHADS
ncbi:glycerol-3-phosphate dehydrogenase [Candidatus Puniceispirillum sp.]|uniref:glycerol-3-phosphate dehydrogenase n=1 Tax=Candidatus Puniceispirillum sp. TaxID=2026719 RepID=UPI003F695B2C